MEIGQCINGLQVQIQHVETSVASYFKPFECVCIYVEVYQEVCMQENMYHECMCVYYHLGIKYAKFPGSL